MVTTSSLHLTHLLLLLCLLCPASSDFATDQSECADQLARLATCLPYVEGQAKAPTPDCCSGLKGVLAKSPKCLCILIKDRDNPQLGININATLALSLPAICSAPASISQCPKLLNLPPNSKDAEVFKQFGSAAAQGNATGSIAKGNTTGDGSGSGRSDLWGGRGGSGVEAVVGTLLLVLLQLVVLNG